MSHIVSENCIKCKYTDCVEVCPVDCFHEGKNFLVINPNICIDCSICLPECPVEAIFTDENILETNIIKKINLELSKIWPIITIKKNLLNSDKWKLIKKKLHLLEL